MTRPQFVLTIDCPDAPGLIHTVSGFLADRSGNIVEAEQFNDPESGRFFQRVHVEMLDETVSAEDLKRDFAEVAQRYAMSWSLWDAARPHRTLLLVSKEGHCLNDLLFRWSTGTLPIEIPAIVSNHLDLKPLADHYGIEFHHIPVTTETKADAEAALVRLVDELEIDLVVLARYMQILSDDLCRQLEGRAINIHHSFLPSFKGARPYHQAWERGVKLVGATAHYVTAELDEGPIIEQDIVRIDHRASAADLVAAGRDVEAQVLSRAVRWHAQTRILLNGHKTVVFR